MKYFLIFFGMVLHADIIQTNCIEDILPYVDETAWVLFDIDNTLVESALHAGRCEWFQYEVEQFMLVEKLDRETADRLLFPKWLAFMDICPIQTPESNTSDVVRKAQEISGACLALTARHPPLLQLTLRNLEQVNIDFSNHAPLTDLLETSPSTHWEKGILFVSMTNPKGVLFRQLIENSETKPKKIIFIDDTLHHLEGMEDELQKLGIAFLGFHYTKSLERPFDPAIASKEYEELIGVKN